MIIFGKVNLIKLFSTYRQLQKVRGKIVKPPNSSNEQNITQLRIKQETREKGKGVCWGDYKYIHFRIYNSYNILMTKN